MVYYFALAAAGSASDLPEGYLKGTGGSWPDLITTKRLNQAGFCFRGPPSLSGQCGAPSTAAADGIGRLSSRVSSDAAVATGGVDVPTRARTSDSCCW